MRHVERLVGLAGIVFACAPACSTKVNGQLMLAIQTDMALPKDIDRIRIEVTNTTTGIGVFKKDFDKLGSNGSIHLPATLGITAPPDSTTSVKIRVLAIHGADASVRVLHDVVTTIPTDRTATLPISLGFLCNGPHEAEHDATGALKRDENDNVLVTSTCDEGKTCIAGTCESSNVPSEKLTDFVEANVFGGGTGIGDGACFDTTSCFADGAEVALDLEAYKLDTRVPKICTAPAMGDINVALRTQGGGICGASGCFVALDADGPAGWKADASGTITLPPSVCEKALAGDIIGLVTAPVGKGSCQKKEVSLPTCGPWSSSGDGSFTPPDPLQPTLVAPGQTNPVELALAGNNIVWTSRGTFDKDGNPNTDGSVKIVPFDGGQPTTIGAGLASPHGIAVDEGRHFILWTNAGSKEIMWAAFPDPGVTPVPSPLLSGLLQPEGIAIRWPTVYWTELASQKVFQLDVHVQGGALEVGNSAEVMELAPPSPAGNSPRGIAAAANAVCWTYEDKLMTSGGVVACSLSNKTVTIASGQRTPRAIAMSVASNGNASAVYWANFDAKSKDPVVPGGGIWKVDLSGMSPGAPVLIADEEYPAGLAVDPDGKTLFWTTRTSLGAVMTKVGDKTPVVLVKDQVNPGSIVLNADTVFWINEGTTNPPAGAVPDGAIMKVTR